MRRTAATMTERQVKRGKGKKKRPGEPKRKNLKSDKSLHQKKTPARLTQEKGHRGEGGIEGELKKKLAAN